MYGIKAFFTLAMIVVVYACVCCACDCACAASSSVACTRIKEPRQVEPVHYQWMGGCLPTATRIVNGTHSHCVHCEDFREQD